MNLCCGKLKGFTRQSLFPKNLGGFTVIELLLVIAIIGLIASIIVVATSGAKAQARDAKRKAEVDAIRKAIEFYYIDHDQYPKKTEWAKLEEDPTLDTGEKFSIAVKEWLSTIPKDPLYGQTKETGELYSYQYKTNDDATEYKIHVETESGTYAAYETYSSGGGGIVYGALADFDILVDDDGKAGPTGCGAEETAYSTIQEGINAAVTGDKIYVCPGTYYESVIIDKSLTLHGEDKATVIIDANGAEKVVETTAPDVTVEGFTIKNAYSSTAMAKGVVVGGSNNRIKGNIIKDIKSDASWSIGIYRSSGGYNYFNNNEICNLTATASNKAAYGIYHWGVLTEVKGNYIHTFNADKAAGIILGTDGTEISNNTIENLTCNAVCAGIALGSGSENNTLSGNKISNITSTLEVFRARGFQFQDSSNNNTATDNEVTNTGRGIYNLSDCIGNVFHNNNIYNNQQYGLYSTATTTVIDAENNWWGDSSGPYHPTTNPGGLGNAVSDYVDYEPWLTSKVEL